MLAAIAQFTIAAVVIIVAGAILTRCADAIAEKTGLGRLLIGSVLLAGTTSLPELSVDITAIRLNLPDLAVGDLLGSSLMNLLILACLDLTFQSRGKMLSRTAAAHALGGLVSISLTAVAGIGLIVAHHAPHWSILGVHLAVWIIGGGYLLGLRMVMLDQRIARRTAVDADVAVDEMYKETSLPRAVVGFLAAAAVVVITGPFLAHAAGDIAKLSGLGSTFVGTTLVALSTSLPEVVTSLSAVRMGAFDLAVGNVFGSNAFNMLLFLPLDFLFPGSLLAEANTSHAVSAFAVVLCSSIAIMGQLYHSESRIHVIEPDAWLVILLVMGALGIVYATA